jgi:hypothetical protein
MCENINLALKGKKLIIPKPENAGLDHISKYNFSNETEMRKMNI